MYVLVLVYLDQILLSLKDKHGFNQFILWGRSMGATTVLRMMVIYSKIIIQQNIYIQYLVLDSPFCSFQKIAKELITKQTGLP